jgi:hypothetical protein
LLRDRYIGRRLRQGKPSSGLVAKPRSGEGGRTEDQSGSAADGSLQNLSACVSVLGHHDWRRV